MSPYACGHMADTREPPQLMDVARECKRLIDRVDSTDPGMLDDGNVIDFLADNLTAVSLIDLRCALAVSGHGQRFPKATGDFTATKRVRVTVTDGMGRKHVHEDTVIPTERTMSVAAHDLIGSVVLRDGDTLSVEFL